MLRQARLMVGISAMWLALSMLSDGLNTLLMPSYLLTWTSQEGQATTLGLVTFVGLILAMFVQPVAGSLSDRAFARWGRRGVITVGVGLVLIALWLLANRLTLPFLIASYLLVQAAASIVQAAQQGFIPDRIPPVQRGMAAGIKGVMDIGGALLVFVLLAQLFEQGKPDLVLPIIGSVFLVSLAITWLGVREPRNAAPTTDPHFTLRHAFELDLTQHRAFAWVVVSRFLFLLGTYAVGRFLFYFTADRLGLTPDEAGEQTAGLLAALTLVTVVGSPIGGWLSDRYGQRPLMAVGAGFSALGVLLLIGAQTSEQLLLFGSLMGLGSAAFSAANWALTANLAPAHEAARFMALANYGTAGAAAAAGLLGPLVDAGNRAAQGNGYTLLFITAAIAFAASGLALLRIRTSNATRDVVTQPAANNL